MSFSFSGTNDPVVRTVTNYADGWTGYAIVSWIKSNIINTNKGWFRTHDNGDAVGGMRYDSTGASGGGDDVIKWGLYANDAQQTVESSALVQTTNLQFLVGQWDSIGTGGDVELWIDGVKDVLTSTKNFTGTIDGTGHNQLCIGQGCKDDAGESWNGDVYEVRIYNRSLSKAEIETMYTLCGADKIFHGLQAHWYGSYLAAPGTTIPTTAAFIKDLSPYNCDLTADAANVLVAESPLRRSKVLV